jgi:hypothetical protein
MISNYGLKPRFQTLLRPIFARLDRMGITGSLPGWAFRFLPAVALLISLNIISRTRNVLKQLPGN